MMPAANWVLELQDMKESLEEATGVNINTPNIQTFQNSVGNPSVSTLKGNISSHFCSHDIVSAFSIFDSKQVWTLPSINSMAKAVLLDQYGGRKTAVSLEGEEYGTGV